MKRSSHIKRIPHIRIGVLDLESSVSFYEDLLGLERIAQWRTYADFHIPGVELALEPKAKPQIPLIADDVDEDYRDLKDAGVKFLTEPEDQPWGGRTATFVDPDGNKFVIESFQCEVCSRICQRYRELLEEHLRKHKADVKG